MKELLVFLVLLWAAMIPCNPAVANDMPTPRLSQAYASAVEEIAIKFRRPISEVSEILDLAQLAAEDVRRTGATFPKMKDILAVIWIESSFNPGASHRAGPSLGLMQVNAGVHGVIWDLNQNITKGSSLLAEYAKRAPNNTMALVYYNAGPKGAKRICGNSSSCKTEYTRKFVRARAELDKVLTLKGGEGVRI